MSLRTETRLFAQHADAVAALHDLGVAGFTPEEVSLVTSEANGLEGGDAQAVTDPQLGAAVGTLLGSGVGLLASLGAVVIPGAGPLVGAGWLVATLAGAGLGAAAGGLVGSLTASGVAEPDAHDLAMGLQRGGTIVVVRTDAARSERAATILAHHLAVHAEADARPADGEGPAVLSAPAPGTPGNPPGR